MYTAMSGCTKKKSNTESSIVLTQKKNVDPLIPYVIKEYNLRTTPFTQKITRDSCMYTYIHFKNNHAWIQLKDTGINLNLYTLDSKIESKKIKRFYLSIEKYTYIYIYRSFSKMIILKYDHKNKIAKNPYKGRNDPRSILLFFDLIFCDRFLHVRTNIIVVIFLTII